MNDIKIGSIISTVIVVWYFIKRWLSEIEKIIEPLCEDIEEACKDGKITKDERKKIALKAIQVLEKQGKIKLNFLTRFIVSKIIDVVSQRLPDFEVSKQSKDLLYQIINLK